MFTVLQYYMQSFLNRYTVFLFYFGKHYKSKVCQVAF